MGPSATSTETTDPEKQSELSHLIIVCCHAIYLGPPSPTTIESSTTIASPRPDELPSSSEANWLIEPFQRGEIATYIGHIEAGIRALAADEHAILVFSGGATKPGKTEKTEGDSYLVSVPQTLCHSIKELSNYATDRGVKHIYDGVPASSGICGFCPLLSAILLKFVQRGQTEMSPQALLRIFAANFNLGS
jgi:hypothetical protein